jgi:hypothetical protein
MRRIIRAVETKEEVGPWNTEVTAGSSIPSAYGSNARDYCRLAEAHSLVLKAETR